MITLTFHLKVMIVGEFQVVRFLSSTMQLAGVILILCSVTALGWACCAPDQWEGTQSKFSSYAAEHSRHGLITEVNDVSYDFKGNRSAVFLRYVNGDIETKVKKVVRYDTDKGGMLYIDNYDKGNCWMKKLKGEFHKACIPTDAKFLGEHFLGVQGGYKVASYMIKGKHMSNILTVQATAKDVCAPIGEISMDRVGEYDILRNVGFVDITLGIKNETVFDVPEDCTDDWKNFDLPINIEDLNSVFAV